MGSLRLARLIIVISLNVAVAACYLRAEPITDPGFFDSISHTLITFEQDGSGAALPISTGLVLSGTEYAAQGVTFLPGVSLRRDNDSCFRFVQNFAGGSAPYGLAAFQTQSMVFNPPVNALGFVFVATSFQFATFTARDANNAVIETIVFAPPFVDGTACGFLEHGFVGITSDRPIARVDIAAFSGLIDQLHFALADADRDAAPDASDNCVQTPNPDQTDTDGDGDGDACDECPGDPAKTRPGLCGCGARETDSDADGVPDCIDECPADPDKLAPGACGCGTPDADADHDGTPDCNDACPGDPTKTGPGVCGCGVADGDSDGDSVADCIDNCPAAGNAAQQDADGDGTGDACDFCPSDPDDDSDLDGVCGDVDNCPAAANPGQADTDYDGRGDACDPCPEDPTNDADGDGVCGDADNCPTAANDRQEDLDGDGLGDACDPDDDNDGLSDVDEDLRGSNPHNADTDGDGLLDGTEIDMALGGDCPGSLIADSDGDGLSDGYEAVTSGTAPCNRDTDGDGIGDRTDPLPRTPGVTSGFAESYARDLAAAVLSLNPSSFNGPNSNANSGRRNTLAHHASAAANQIAQGQHAAAIVPLADLLSKIDDEVSPPDWMSSSPQKTALADQVRELIHLLRLFP